MGYHVKQKGIAIISDLPVSVTQQVDETLRYENLRMNQEKYHNYQRTPMQFHIAGQSNQSLEIIIPYHNRLTPTESKHAVIARYHEELKDWVKVDHTIDTKKKTFHVTTNETGIYQVFIDRYWYTSFTQRLADEYPHWATIRNDKESIGQQFLNFFGIELETIQDYLEWVHEQKYIDTADLTTYDWISMYATPRIDSRDKVKLYYQGKNGRQEIPVLETLQSFFYNKRGEGVIFDYEEKRIYTPYDYGKIELVVTKEYRTNTYVIEPRPYHLWNTFDEFGLLLGVKRLYLEDNASMKERILDVFRYPSGTHDEGLTNGIARDLNMIQRLTWKDDFKDFIVKNTSGSFIDIRTLRVDNLPLDEEEYEADDAGNIRIYKKNQGNVHEVSFITGIEKYQIYDKENTSLYQIMYEADGQATATLRHWVEYINTVAPVMWNRFNWDEGFWDTISKDLTGLGYVPNIWDSNIDAWKDYTIESTI